MKTKWVKLVTQQDTFLISFEKSATNKVTSFYKKTVSGHYIDEVNRMRKIAFDVKTAGGFGINATYWFDTITKKINLLKKIDDYLSSQLNKTIGDELSSVKSSLYILLTFLLIIIALTTIISIVVIKNIISTINNFQTGFLNFFKYINREANDVQMLDDSSSDEFGAMAKVVNQNIVITKKGIEEDNRFIADTQAV